MSAWFERYVRFVVRHRWAVLAVVGLVLSFVLIALFHRGEFADGARLVAEPPRRRARRVLMVRALVATAVLVALFFVGQPPAKAAIVIGGLLLATVATLLFVPVVFSMIRHKMRPRDSADDPELAPTQLQPAIQH